MTKWAKLPDGTWLKFADETPPEVVQKTYKEQLQAHQGGAPLALPEGAISSAEDVRDPATGVPGGVTTAPKPKPSTAEYIWDIVKSAPSDVAKLVTETAMTPISIGRMGSIESPPEDRPWYRQTLPQLLGYEEYAKPAREALVGGQDVVRKTITENLPQPQYLPGQIAEEGVQWLGPASVPTKATRLATGVPRFVSHAGDILAHGAMPWGAYEAADEYGGPLTGTGAALATALLTGAGRTSRSPEAVVRRESATVTDEHWADAKRLQAYAKSEGIDLSASEAIAEITNQPNHPLLKSLRLSEAHPSGAAVTGPFFEPRAQQVDTAVNRSFDAIAPSPANPQTIGPQVSRAADKAIGETMDIRKSATEPLYTQADTMNVPEPSVRKVADELDALIASDTSNILPPPLRELRQRLVRTPAQPPKPTGVLDQQGNMTMSPGTPEVLATDVATLDRIKKFYRDSMDLVANSNNPELMSFVGERGARISKAIGDLDQTMTQSSQPFAQAKGTHELLTKTAVEPVAAGPVGNFAKAGSTEDVVRLLFPGTPTSATTSALADAIGRIRATGQEMLPAARDALDRIFSRVSGGTLAGDRSRVGAKFAQVMSGSPQKQELLDTVLAATGAPVPATKNFGDLLEVLQATGKRLGEGSPTAQLNAQMGDLSSIPALDAASAIATNSLGPLFTGGLKDYVLRGNIKDLAGLTTGSVQDLQAAGARAWQNLVPDVLKRTGLSTLFATGRDQ